MRLIFFFILIGMAGPVCCAQNVASYNTIPEPLLFLLREPAVHRDLNLTDRQKEKLVSLNHKHDATLLSSRNRPAEKSQEQTNQILGETQEAIKKLLTKRQHQRLNQIRYRLRGISFVLMPEVVEKLKMSSQQQQQIQKIVDNTQKVIAKLQTEINKGVKTQSQAQKIGKEARTKEQTQILGLLDKNQRKQLVSVVGSNFDVAQLGRVSFKAPELSTTGEWINSDPLTLSGLHGKVVALHFWAFG